jgi:hypothetical protein
MFKTIADEFTQNRFIVAPTSFDNIAIDPELKSVVQAKRDTDLCARLLYYFPDFFVYPRDIAPEKGCFFGIISKGKESFPDARTAMLKAHFPCDRIVVFFQQTDGSIVCTWYMKENWMPISDFIQALRK